MDPEAYMSPCPSGTTWLSANPTRPFDVHVVSTAVLTTTGVPASYPITAIYVSGTVFTASANGPSPVAGALVALGDETTISYSTTQSDSQGRYVVCTAPPGVGTDQTMPVHVTKDGFLPGDRAVIGGGNTSGVGVELLRNR
jgi:hypothetical protein